MVVARPIRYLVVVDVALQIRAHQLLRRLIADRSHIHEEVCHALGVGSRVVKEVYAIWSKRHRHELEGMTRGHGWRTWHAFDLQGALVSTVLDDELLQVKEGLLVLDLHPNTQTLSLACPSAISQDWPTFWRT